MNIDSKRQMFLMFGSLQHKLKLNDHRTFLEEIGVSKEQMIDLEKALKPVAAALAMASMAAITTSS